MNLRLRIIGAAVACMLLLVAYLATARATTGVPALETQVLGQSEWLAGSRCSLRVIARNHLTGATISGAGVRIQLVSKDGSSKSLFTGTTDRDGTLQASFRAPDMGEYELKVSVTALGETDEVSEKVTVRRDYKILLTTDKPLYQPGQTLHIRALALSRGDLAAAGGRSLTIEVEDAKGNKVFKKTALTSKFGVASADFTLASEVNMGRYTVCALLEQSKVEKSVTVDRYVLPKFKIKFTPRKSFYLAGETVSGRVQADYFFGKPVDDAKVSIKAATFDASFRDFAEIAGQTDGEGGFDFSQELPSYFVGQPLEQGDAFVKFEVSVTDGANHTEKITQMVPVAAQSLKLVAVPAGGRVVPGVENIVYVMTVRPDGTPASTEVSVTAEGREYRLRTDASGIGSFRITPKSGNLDLQMRADDSRARVTLSGESDEDSILLRAGKSLAKVGDPLRLDILSPSAKGTVYLDLVHDGQTLLTRSVQLTGGRAWQYVALTPEMSGCLEIHAYRISCSGNIVRSTSLVYVDPASDLNVKITPDKKTYLPGGAARIGFDVTDARGRGVAAALGVAIVDESVFALSEMQPGMEKVYFLLEKELAEPKFELHGLTPATVVDGIEKREAAAGVLFSLALANREKETAYTLSANSYTQKLEKLRESVLEDRKQIAAAVEAYYSKHGGSLAEAGGISHLVKLGLLDEKYLKDGFGREYRFEPCGCGNYSHDVTVESAGPDGRFNTDDDISSAWAANLGAAWGLGGFDGDADFFLKGAIPMAVEERASVLDFAGSPAPASKSEKPDVRVRQYFPETMYWNPSVITDERGKGSIDLTVADSITTWRISATASSANGRLGSATQGLTVFQDFFIDIDLPTHLTQNDEVSIPVAVYNYLPSAQKVRLEIAEEPWFELMDAPEKTLDIGEGDVKGIYFRIRVKKIGTHRLTVHAFGSKMNDAVSREIEVAPDGREFLVTANDRLEGSVDKTITIPEEAIDGASNILVKVYPGIFSQVVEGMDGILQMPYGCFEQTSSTTYPNVLALDYMKRTGRITPEVEMKAEQYINLGYQRLVTFEVSGGGFSWFGEAPANKILTAYGLMEFSDMARVYEVDDRLIERTRSWLLEQREGDGSWTPDENYLHEESWGKIQKSRLLPTAWITWALAESGAKAEELRPSLDYLRKNAGDAKDPYTLAILCNALIAAGEKSPESLERLMEMKTEEDGAVYWKSEMATVTFTRGKSADVETTALAAYALVRSGRHPGVAGKALTYIVRAKDANGTWGSTQATVLALKALLASLGGSEEIDGEVTVTVNGEKVQSFRITPEDADVVRQIDCKAFVKEGENKVQIAFTGKGSALYQITGRYYMPWEEKPSEKKLISIDVDFDRTELATSDILTSTVRVAYNRPGSAQMVMVDLGIPPGFEVLPADLDALVGKVIQKYTITGRQVILYFDKVESGSPVEFKYRMRAKFPIRAQTPESSAYLYYNPEIRDVQPPVELVVR
ncbi:MAG: alpha-2-macroglobulin family protein [Armatimonadota bacterium]